jgi:YD repeat-containing protein
MGAGRCACWRRGLRLGVGVGRMGGWRGVAMLGLMWVGVGDGVTADKSGVSPNAISLPKGPGSIEGLGESFQPTLNTGTARHGVELKLAPGTAGHQPAVSFRYDGGGSNGPLGYGWGLGVPHIQRRTDKGIPTYGEQLGVLREDVFINEEREELVPGEDDFWFCANEGSFVRYRRVGAHWEGMTPEGTRLEFGLTPEGRVWDGATGRVFSWLLERETDTRGNVIEFEYQSFAGEQNLNQRYLARIRYGPGAPPWQHYQYVALEYEDRSDWFEDGRAGFLVRTGKRLKAVWIGTQGVELPGHLAGDFDGDGRVDYLNRRYDLGYLRYAGEGSHWSLLAEVRLVGADGATALPPARFGYGVSDPPMEISALEQVWGGVDEPPAVMDNALVDLVDLNADGLPDVLRTESSGGAHTAWLNRGPGVGLGERAIRWWGPVPVDPGEGTAWNFDLASDRTHLADMDGDGLADLVHRSGDDTVFYFSNRGRVAWGERQDMTLTGAAPPSPFGNPGVQAADLDFDKRTDVIQSLDVGGGLAYRVWFNLGAQEYSPPVTVEPDGGFDLTLAGVQIADCNGDRVPDVARVQAEVVWVGAGLGYGRFAAVRPMALPDVTLDGDQIARAKLTDLNGDGLADLVLERAAPGECWYWLNLGNYTFGTRKRIVDLPVVSVAAAVRWADLNGNGTTDLVYADAQGTPRIQFVELGELIGGGLAPNLLTRIENGIGRVTEIEYAPSTRFALEDEAAGEPWPDALPFPVTVVAGMRVSDSLGNDYEVRFRYHDGYYDPVEKQFRGFGRVEQIDLGDSTAPTLLTRSHFDTGRLHDAMKGRLLRTSTETLDGGVFTVQTTRWIDPPRVLRVGANGELVRYAHPVANVKEVVELGLGVTRRMESEFEYDVYGNQTRHADYGVVEGADRGAWNDERIVVTEYALNLDAWIVRLPSRQWVQDAAGIVISRAEMFYDDESFSGSNLGSMTSGKMTLRREWVDPALPEAHVAVNRTKYDPFGNAVMRLDPLALAPGGAVDVSEGHVREVAYDARFGAYPVSETIHVGQGKAPLVYEGAYDEGLGVILSSTDFNGHRTVFGHDPLGRLTSVVRPYDSAAFPSIEYEYALAVPVSGSPGGFGGQGQGFVNFIETRQLDREAGTQATRRDHYLVSRQFTDGLGRPLQARTEAEPARGRTAPRVVVSGATQFNARQTAARVLNPHFSRVEGGLDEQLAFEPLEADDWTGWFHTGGELVMLGLEDAPATVMLYDASLRTLETTNPDGTRVRVRHEPLVTRTYDENDTDELSPHRDTPLVHVSDGLGRLIRVDEVVRLGDDGTPATAVRVWSTHYQYEVNDQLTRVTDSQGNVRAMEYDGLRRKVRMNDPDNGISATVYDAASNVVETTDAKGQRIRFTYDGANRVLSEDYDDEESVEFSYGRGPDVRYYYDDPAGLVDQGDGTDARARNTKGMLAWVEDCSGEEHSSFDERGRVEWTVKRVPDPILSPTLDAGLAELTAYRTVFEYDSMERMTRLVYPDNDEVRYRYNARSLPEAIIGGPNGTIVSEIEYGPSGQQQEVVYGNGVRTRHSYDARQRLTRLTTVGPGVGGSSSGEGLALMDFRYEFDGVSNVRAIHDERPVQVVSGEDRRRNAQVFSYDDLNRLTRVRYNLPNPVGINGGEIHYRYDRIGNLLAQTSDLEPLAGDRHGPDLGELDYGGEAGRSGRVGRGAGDPPGPHALSLIGTGGPVEARTIVYDANGNITELDGLRFTWDFRDRLVVVEDGRMRAEYRYDYAGRRMLKRVVWHDPAGVGVEGAVSDGGASPGGSGGSAGVGDRDVVVRPATPVVDAADPVVLSGDDRADGADAAMSDHASLDSSGLL